MCSFPFLAELRQLQVILMFQNSEAPVWSLVPFVLHSFLAALGLPCCLQALCGCRRQGLPQLACPGLWLRQLRLCRARALHHGLSTGGCGWPWLLSVVWDLLGPEKIGRQMLHRWTPGESRPFVLLFNKSCLHGVLGTHMALGWLRNQRNQMQLLPPLADSLVE